MKSHKLKLLFISTNGIWSGSEVLWYNAALRLRQHGHQISVATYYKNNHISCLAKSASNYLNLKHRFILPRKIWATLNAVFPFIGYLDNLRRLARDNKFDLAVISQGNNISSHEILSLFAELKIPFITLTQLVTPFHFLHMSEEIRSSLTHSYSHSRVNFFVSRQNEEIHNLMTGRKSLNSRVIHNPITTLSIPPPAYPSLEKGFQLAFVGRIEAFHKGLDLLVQVISKPKWIKRPIRFNFYGSGPHISWLKDSISLYNITNAFIHGSVDDIVSIWKANHLLILPSRMEGQSLALLEALACSRAAVLTDVGGARSVVDDNVSGFIAAQPSTACIDDALERAWDARAHWKDIGFKARTALLESIEEDPIDLFIKEILALA